MQTFLPYPDFAESARALDYRRLNKQRLEAQQILRVLTGQMTGWSNHPVVRMWAGYEVSLGHYYDAIVAEWIHRGYRNTMVTSYRYVAPTLADLPRLDPPWLGDPQFHAAYRRRLYDKDSIFYHRLWDEDGTPVPVPGE